MTNDYIESVWWSLREIWDAGRLYEGHKVVPYCPRCGTALSSHEVAQGYRDVEDPSVYVRLPITQVPPADQIAESPIEVGDNLLVWTTTPWTLISHAAVAAGAEIEYVRARLGDEVLIVAQPLVERVLGEAAEVLADFPGDALSGVRYEAPFEYIPGAEFGPLGHSVLLGDFVTTEDGTGLVHTALAFGEDDFRLGEQYRMTLQNPVLAQRSLRRPRPGFPGQVRVRAQPGDRRRARGEGTTVSLRGLRARLPALLALRDAAALLREGELVHPHDRGPRPDAGRERADRLAPGARQARALRQVAGGQRGLGALAGALLGHAAADLGVHRPLLRRRLLRRLGRRAARARRRGPRRPAPPVHRRRRRSRARAAAARCGGSRR